MLWLIYPSLVLVQPRKTCTCLTERLLMGRKESNQTKTTILIQVLSTSWSVLFYTGFIALPPVLFNSSFITFHQYSFVQVLYQLYQTD